MTKTTTTITTTITTTLMGFDTIEINLVLFYFRSKQMCKPNRCVKKCQKQRKQVWPEAHDQGWMLAWRW